MPVDGKCLLVLCPCSYAREDSTVVLTGVTLFDNLVPRGSVVFLVESTLKAYQV